MRSMKTRVVTTVLIALAVLVASLAVPAGVLASGAQEVDDGDGTYRFRAAFGPWSGADGAMPPEDQPDHRIFQYVEDEIGIVPLVTSWEWGGGLGHIEGLRLALASGEEFEAITPWSYDLANELIEEGLAVNLDPYIAQHPEIQARFDAETWERLRRQQGGNIYYIPLRPQISGARAGFIRNDWLDRVGLPAPTTRDELVEVYRAFQRQDANGNGDPDDEIPVSGRELFRWFDDLFVMHGVAMYEGHPRWKWNDERGILESSQVSEGMFEAVKFIHSLYREGLMDPEMPNLPGGDWGAKVRANLTGHYFHLVGLIHRNTLFMEDDPTPDPTGFEYWDIMPAPPVWEPAGRQGHYYPQVGQPNFMILTYARDPGRIMEWLAWSEREENRLVYHFGMEGEDWARDENGEIEVINDIRALFPWIGGIGEPEEVLAKTPLGELKVNWINRLEGNLLRLDDEFMPVSVYSGFEDFAPQNATLYRQAIGRMITQNEEPTREQWDAYVERWYESGGQVVTDRATEWYREFNAM